MSTAFRPKPVVAWHVLVGVGLVVLGWHLPLMWQGTEKVRAPAAVRGSGRDTFVFWQPPQVEIQVNPVLWQDPTVYLLPGQMGFSRNLTKVLAEPRLTVENTLPPTVLAPERPEQPAEPAGGKPSLVSLMDSLREMGDRAAESPPPREVWSSVGSAWRVTGRIAQRLPQAGAPLPLIQSAESLGPTLLRVGISPQGDPQYVLIERSSGSEKADEAGIRFARGLGFSSSDAPEDAPVAWGFLKICWQPEPVPGKA